MLFPLMISPLLLSLDYFLPVNDLILICLIIRQEGELENKN